MRDPPNWDERRNVSIQPLADCLEWQPLDWRQIFAIEMAQLLSSEEIDKSKQQIILAIGNKRDAIINLINSRRGIADPFSSSAYQGALDNIQRIFVLTRRANHKPRGSHVDFLAIAHQIKLVVGF